MRKKSGTALISLFLVSACLSACVTSRIRPLAPVNGDAQTGASSVKIFLLERDIPQNIEQLGTVSISVNGRPTLGVDEEVKQQLRKDCQQLGANGAYRVNDGTYYPLVVSYLVFRYKE